MLVCGVKGFSFLKKLSGNFGHFIFKKYSIWGKHAWANIMSSMGRAQWSSLFAYTAKPLKTEPFRNKQKVRFS